MEANDLASMADMVASKASSVHSAATPPAATTTRGSSQLAPINVDADDLASMDNTATIPLDSSSDSSISEDPSEGSPVAFTSYVFNCLATTPAAPPEDMVMELPEVDPDPGPLDTNMPDHSTTSLLSVGDQQQTLGDGPPTAPPPKEHTNPGSALAIPGEWV